MVLAILSIEAFVSQDWDVADPRSVSIASYASDLKDGLYAAFISKWGEGQAERIDERLQVMKKDMNFNWEFYLWFFLLVGIQLLVLLIVSLWYG